MIIRFLRTMIAALLLLGACSLHAESAIEQLIRETGIEAGPVPISDRPGWHTPKKILIRADKDLVAEMQKALPDVQLIAINRASDAMQHVADADAIIGYCSARVIAAAKNLLWMQIYSAGADRCMPIERIANDEILLTNMQKMSSPVIAEHAMAMILSLARGFPKYAKSMSEGSWQRGPEFTQGMQSIAGKTVLVIGLGGIGTEVARRAAALDMRVIGTRRSSREGPDFVDYVGLSHELIELAGDADFIVNALPLTAETSGLIDSNFFAATKRGAHFINVGRGRTVVTDALVAALESGQIAGAGLDVTDPEPLPADHPLWQMDNVIITPHVASGGGNWVRHNILIKENLARFVAGDALLNVVNPELGY